MARLHKLPGAVRDGGRWRVRTGWKTLLGAFERVSRERVAVPPAVVLLCACPRAGAGMSGAFVTVDGSLYMYRSMNAKHAYKEDWYAEGKADMNNNGIPTAVAGRYIAAWYIGSATSDIFRAHGQSAAPGRRAARAPQTQTTDTIRSRVAGHVLLRPPQDYVLLPHLKPIPLSRVRAWVFELNRVPWHRKLMVERRQSCRCWCGRARLCAGAPVCH
jgi:hypothetical protein